MSPVNSETLLPGVHLWSRPAEQAVSWLLPSEHHVVLGHGLSVVDVFILILQSSNAKRLQLRGERLSHANEAPPLHPENDRMKVSGNLPVPPLLFFDRLPLIHQTGDSWRLTAGRTG